MSFYSLIIYFLSINSLNHAVNRQVSNKLKQSESNSVLLTKINTEPGNLAKVLLNELSDLSEGARERIANSLLNMNSSRDYDTSKFKDVIYLKKKIIDRGDHEIINIKLEEQLVPIDSEGDDESFRDFSIKAVVGGLLFLFIGLILTIGLKMYHEYIKDQIFVNTSVKTNIGGENKNFDDVEDVITSTKKIKDEDEI
ncbi:hypothetical protein CDIK_1315 [Cucumispora dikerogammari]|nr:hypothetical protein CDIK_1315 [Cucumispora dikerogammari]